MKHNQQKSFMLRTYNVFDKIQIQKNTLRTSYLSLILFGISIFSAFSQVTNINTSEVFVTIQSAINAPLTLTNHVLEVSSGTYNEQVLVTKGVTIRGVGVTQPIVDFIGTVTGKPTLFDVSVDGVTIENINFNVDMANIRSAIIASSVGLDNITIINNVIDGYGTPGGSYGDRNAVSVNYSGPVNYRVASGGVDNIIFTGNTVNGTLPASFFRSGISTDESGGTYSNNTLQTINHDIIVRFGNNGAVNITNNDFNGGGVDLSDQNAGAGTLTISGNNFTGAGAPGAALLRIKNNYNTRPHVVSGNSFTDFEWAISLENMNNITLDGNTFSSTFPTARAVVKNTKSITSNSSLIVQVPVEATFTNNDFSGNGTALIFQNHDSDDDSYGAFNIGTMGNPNTFAATLTNFVVLDDQTGSTNGSTFPIYPSTAQWETTMDCWSTNLSIQHNTYDLGSGQQSPLTMDEGERAALESKLYHNPDVACLGELFYFFPVHNVTQNTFHMTIQDAIDAITTVANDVIEVPSGTYSITSTITVNKGVTINGPQDDVDPRTYAALRTPGSVSEAIVNGGGTVDIIFNITVAGVTLNGLEITNSTGDLVASPAGAPVKTDVTVKYCIVHNSSTDEGIQLRNLDNGSISYNRVFNIAGDGINMCCGSTNSVLDNNEVSGSASGDGVIYLYDCGPFNEVTNNSIYSNSAADGIKIGNKDGTNFNSNSAFSNNAIISGNNINGNSSSTGIGLYLNTSRLTVTNNTITNCGSNVNASLYFRYNIKDITVTQNTFTDNYRGIRVGSSVTQANTLSINQNNIDGNSVEGLQNSSATLVNAQANWWGDASGPSGAGPGTGDAVSSNVTFCPWLDGPNPTGVPINGGGLGEVKNTTTNVLYCSIQVALDASLLGEEIHFNSGTSTETVTIDVGKKLVINIDATLTNNTTLTNNGTLEKIGAYINHGIYTGYGVFIGNFVNNGTFKPGN